MITIVIEVVNDKSATKELIKSMLKSNTNTIEEQKQLKEIEKEMHKRFKSGYRKMEKLNIDNEEVDNIQNSD